MENDCGVLSTLQEKQLLLEESELTMLLDTLLWNKSFEEQDFFSSVMWKDSLRVLS